MYLHFKMRTENFSNFEKRTLFILLIFFSKSWDLSAERTENHKYTD